jgi:hypothetical protein
MGNLELPGAATGSKQMLKVPVGTYEFGANLISEKGVSTRTRTDDSEVARVLCQPFSCLHLAARRDQLQGILQVLQTYLDGALCSAAAAAAVC